MDKYEVFLLFKIYLIKKSLYIEKKTFTGVPKNILSTLSTLIFAIDHYWELMEGLL